MFPNVRLMIVAMLASVVVLSLFAVFGVNHVPLGSPPSSRAPLQLVIESPASKSAAVVAEQTIVAVGQATARRAETGLVPAADAPPASSQREPDRLDAADTQVELPSLQAKAPGLNENAPQDRAADTAAEAAPVLAPDVSVTGSLTDQPRSAERPPASVSDVAAIDSLPQRSPSAEQTTGEAESEISETTEAGSGHEGARKAAGRQRLAAKMHRAARPRGRTMASLNRRNSAVLRSRTAFLQPHFVTAFAQPLYRSAPRVVRVRSAARRRLGKGSAIGGPFVSAVSR